MKILTVQILSQLRDDHIFKSGSTEQVCDCCIVVIVNYKSKNLLLPLERTILNGDQRYSFEINLIINIKRKNLNNSIYM